MLDQALYSEIPVSPVVCTKCFALCPEALLEGEAHQVKPQLAPLCPHVEATHEGIAGTPNPTLPVEVV